MGYGVMTDDKKDGQRLGLGLLNGMVLVPIGVLVLLTPMVAGETLNAGQVKLDLVAGGLLLLAGLVFLALHFLRGQE